MKHRIRSYLKRVRQTIHLQSLPPSRARNKGILTIIGALLYFGAAGILFLYPISFLHTLLNGLRQPELLDLGLGVSGLLGGILIIGTKGIRSLYTGVLYWQQASTSSRITVRKTSNVDLGVLSSKNMDWTKLTGSIQDTLLAWQQVLQSPAAQWAILFDKRVAGVAVHYRHDGRAWLGFGIQRNMLTDEIATLAFARLLAKIIERPLYVQIPAQNIPCTRIVETCGFMRWVENDWPFGDMATEIVFRLD